MTRKQKKIIHLVSFLDVQTFFMSISLVCEIYFFIKNITYIVDFHIIIIIVLIVV